MSSRSPGAHPIQVATITGLGVTPTLAAEIEQVFGR
jgi:hypothetical protein